MSLNILPSSDVQIKSVIFYIISHNINVNNNVKTIHYSKGTIYL